MCEIIVPATKPCEKWFKSSNFGKIKFEEAKLEALLDEELYQTQEELVEVVQIGINFIYILNLFG